MASPTLSHDTLADYVTRVSRSHPELATIVRTHGMPAAFMDEASFAGLVRIILGQHVATSAAKAAEHRLRDALGELSVAAVLSQPEALETARLTRQKRRYILALAEALADGSLVLAELNNAPDAEVRAALTAIPGIGDWSADIYLMACLKRLDVFPAGDLALRKAVQQLAALPETPSIRYTASYATRYAPYRSVAARILWHWYVQTR